MKKDGWISVKDRLPEPKAAVLAAFDDGGVDLIAYQRWAYENLEEALVYSTAEDWNVHHTVTHWMPVPEPPEEAGK